MVTARKSSDDGSKPSVVDVSDTTASRDGGGDINARMANPLAGYTPAELAHMGEVYATTHDIGGSEDVRAFRFGAVLAQNPNVVPPIDGLTAEEIAALDKELTHKWSQPVLLYLVIVLCSACAAVQGMGTYSPSSQREVS